MPLPAGLLKMMDNKKRMAELNTADYRAFEVFIKEYAGNGSIGVVSSQLRVCKTEAQKLLDANGKLENQKVYVESTKKIFEARKSAISAIDSDPDRRGNPNNYPHNRSNLLEQLSKNNSELKSLMDDNTDIFVKAVADGEAAGFGRNWTPCYNDPSRKGGSSYGSASGTGSGSGSGTGLGSGSGSGTGSVSGSGSGSQPGTGSLSGSHSRLLVDTTGYSSAFKEESPIISFFYDFIDAIIEIIN